MDDDCHWVTCLNEASLISKPRIIRVLFFNILVYCSPSEPDKLLEQFQDSMSEDFKRLHEQSATLSEEDVKKHAYNDLLTSVNKLLKKQGKTNEYYYLPMPDESLTHPEVLSTSEIDLNASSYFDSNHILMNLEQKEIFQLLKGHIERGEGGCYNLDAPGGSGKTFLSNITLAFIRKENSIAIATALLGIASTLLTLGTTFHRRFGVPIPTLRDSSSKIILNSPDALIIKAAKLIIIDEVSMMSHRLLDLLDRFLQELERITPSWEGN